MSRTTVRIIVWGSVYSRNDVAVSRRIVNVVEITARLFRKDGSTTAAGSKLLRKILDESRNIGRIRDKKIRRLQEITVEIVGPFRE